MPRPYISHISADEGRKHDSEDCAAAVPFEQKLALMLSNDSVGHE